MKEADIAEVSKRNILSHANYRCEACGKTLGYGKDEESPHFYWIVQPFQGGEKKDTNLTVLCETDGNQFHKLDKKKLNDRVMYREVAEPDT
jgi:hypothetical protein